MSGTLRDGSRDEGWRNDPDLPGLRSVLARLERQAAVRGDMETIERLSQIDMAAALEDYKRSKPGA